MRKWLLLTLLVAAPLANASDILGIKIYYSKSVVKIPWVDFEKQWVKAPDDDVQVILIYPKRKHGGQYQPDEMHGADFYWWSPTKGLGQANELSGLPGDAIVKRGKWMYPDSAYLKRYNEAHNDHVW